MLGFDLLICNDILFELPHIASAQILLQPICQIDGYSLSSDLWTAIHNGSCTSYCLQPFNSCSKSSLPPAPSPSASASTSTSTSSNYLELGDWSTCMAQCSNETQYRPAICRSNASSLPIVLSACSSFNLQTVEASVFKISTDTDCWSYLTRLVDLAQNCRHYQP